MHSFLRAIGFSSIQNRGQLDNLLGQVMNAPTMKSSYPAGTKQTYTEFRRDFAEGIGLAIRGEYDAYGFFHLEHYFPYFIGPLVTAKEDVMIHKRVDTDAFTAMCDDYRLGISLIFYLINSVDYLQSKTRQSDGRMAPVTLSALSTSGMILLPVTKPKTRGKNVTDFGRRTKLIAEAKAGNQEAMDNLALDEIDLYANISRRARVEDLYTIVDTTFIPYGTESDNYSIIGTILNWKLVTNRFSGEEVYQLQISCNDLVFAICIAKADLLGEPMIGRRFKGTVWMQGQVDFTEL